MDHRVLAKKEKNKKDGGAIAIKELTFVKIRAEEAKEQNKDEMKWLIRRLADPNDLIGIHSQHTTVIYKSI